MMTEARKPLAGILTVSRPLTLLKFSNSDVWRSFQVVLPLKEATEPAIRGSRASFPNLLLFQGLGRGLFPQLPQLRPH